MRTGTRFRDFENHCHKWCNKDWTKIFILPCIMLSGMFKWSSIHLIAVLQTRRQRCMNSVLLNLTGFSYFWLFPFTSLLDKRERKIKFSFRYVMNQRWKYQSTISSNSPKSVRAKRADFCCALDNWWQCLKGKDHWGFSLFGRGSKLSYGTVHLEKKK